MPLLSCYTRAGLNASFPVAFSFRWADRNSVRRRPAIRARNLPVSLNASSCTAGSSPAVTNSVATISFSSFSLTALMSPASARVRQGGGSDLSAMPCNLSQLKPCVFALRRIAKLVRFRARAMVSTLFALRTSARSSLSFGRPRPSWRPCHCPSPHRGQAWPNL